MTEARGSTSRSFRLYGLLAETFIHPGIGQAQEAIELPVAREATTGFPYIAGSSVKGAARDAFRRHWRDVDDRGERIATQAENTLFGPADTTGADISAGVLILSDVRLLLLPVRSLTGACRYVTCPELIYRLLADLQRAGLDTDLAVRELANAAPRLLPVSDNKAISQTHAGPLFLEELCFTSEPNSEVATFVACAKRLGPQAGGFCTALERRLTILTDDAFAWFAANALPVRMRNALEESGSKKVKDGALWSEEYLAPDTLMYTLVGTRGAPSQTVTINGTPYPLLEAFNELLKADKSYLQVGGNETVGHGWFRVSEFGTNLQRN